MGCAPHMDTFICACGCLRQAPLRHFRGGPPPPNRHTAIRPARRLHRVALRMWVWGEGAGADRTAEGVDNVIAVYADPLPAQLGKNDLGAEFIL